MKYYEKYLKYKQKYLELKNKHIQRGGQEIIDSLVLGLIGTDRFIPEFIKPKSIRYPIPDADITKYMGYDIFIDNHLDITKINSIDDVGFKDLLKSNISKFLNSIFNKDRLTIPTELEQLIPLFNRSIDLYNGMITDINDDFIQNYFINLDLNKLDSLTYSKFIFLIKIYTIFLNKIISLVNSENIKQSFAELKYLYVLLLLFKNIEFTISTAESLANSINSNTKRIQGKFILNSYCVKLEFKNTVNSFISSIVEEINALNNLTTNFLNKIKTEIKNPIVNIFEDSQNFGYCEDLAKTTIKPEIVTYFEHNTNLSSGQRQMLLNLDFDKLTGSDINEKINTIIQSNFFKSLSRSGGIDGSIFKNITEFNQDMINFILGVEYDKFDPIKYKVLATNPELKEYFQSIEMDLSNFNKIVDIFKNPELKAYFQSIEMDLSNFDKIVEIFRNPELKEYFKSIGMNLSNVDKIFKIFNNNKLKRYFQSIEMELSNVDKIIKIYDSLLFKNNTEWFSDNIQLIINYLVERYDKILKILSLQTGAKFEELKKINISLIKDLFGNQVDYYIFDIYNCQEKHMQNKIINCDFSVKHIFIKGNAMSMSNLEKLCDYNEENKEQQEYLREFLYVMVKTTDKCYHATNLFNKFNTLIIKNFNEKIGKYNGDFESQVLYFTDDFINDNKENIFFWLKNLIGQEEYGGGWYTFNTSESGPAGGPKFGLILEYSVKEEFPLLYVPPIYKDIFQNKKENTRYFVELNKKDNEVLKGYTETSEWSGSHVIQGPRHWRCSDFEAIEHPRTTIYADNLTKKLLSLNFHGYISCDECEIFLDHFIQKEYINRVPNYEISNEYWQIYSNLFDLYEIKNKQTYIEKIKKFTEGIIPQNNIPSIKNRYTLSTYEKNIVKVLKCRVEGKIDSTNSLFNKIFKKNIITKSFPIERLEVLGNLRINLE